MNGKVYLVGAGPGDGGLMTIKGRELLQKADVVVYDRLVGQEVMDMIPDDTEKVDVGKNAGSHPVPQKRINEILAEHASAGKTVVRLKGGDPFVFGRGGEEIELLQQEHIDFEVVPGITSSIAAPAYAGIPVTHRDLCSSLHIITGHARAGAELKIDFGSLVKLEGTLIFMMSVSSSGMIAQGLMDAGMSDEMPCAVIENGTLPHQRKFVSTIGKLSDTVAENKVHSPAVIVVGKVCSLSDRLDWFSSMPLFGRKILVTQPQGRASRMAGGLRSMGAEAVLYPCIKTEDIRPLEIPGFEDLNDPSDADLRNGRKDGSRPADAIGSRPADTISSRPADTIVFTSAAGVRSFCEWLLEQGSDMRSLRGCRIACIGSATAGALKNYGLKADFVPSVYSGKALGEEMVSSGFVNRDSRVLLLRTDAASPDVTEVLDEAGIRYEDIPVYTTKLLKHDAIKDLGSYDFVTFTSRSCVNGFVRSQTCGADEDGDGSSDVSGPPASKQGEALKTGEAVQHKAFSGIKALCIGAQTAAEAEKYGFEVTVSEKATIESMLETAAKM